MPEARLNIYGSKIRLKDLVRYLFHYVGGSITANVPKSKNKRIKTPCCIGGAIDEQIIFENKFPTP